MKWRIAKKIRETIGTDRESRYTGAQLDAALRRYERLQSSKEDNRFFHQLMQEIGVEGRARILAKRSPGLAFKLLMREDW